MSNVKITINYNLKTLSVDGKEIDFTEKQFNMLVYFIQHSPAQLSYKEIYQANWDNCAPDYFSKGPVREEVSKIKKKAPALEAFIENAYGSGYKVAFPPEAIHVITQGRRAGDPQSAFFGALTTISGISLPDYSSLSSSDTKLCTVSRAALIALAKHFLQIDLDNELSEGFSADELNLRAQSSHHALLKDFWERGYRFEEKNGLIVVKVPEDAGESETDNDALFDLFTAFHEAYKAYPIHESVSAPKKIELNSSISVFSNALAIRGVFNTVERKNAFCDFLSSMIRTHNHDCNFLFPVLCGKEKKPPLLEVGIDKVVELVGDYSYDVYLTDNNPLSFMGNFIKTLDHYPLDRAKKIGIIEHLVYAKKAYDLRLIKRIPEIDKGRLVTLQKHLEANVFSLAGAPLTEDVRRELIAFVCMFGRAPFDGLIYFEAPSAAAFLKSFSDLINFVIRRFDALVPEGHLRRKDLAHSLSLVLLTMRKYNETQAKETLKNVSVERFENHRLFKETYAFIVHNQISVLCASEYAKSFPTREAFFQYITEHLLCSENPFLSEDNPLLLHALSHIRAAANGENRENVPPSLKRFADDLLFWMIEAAEADAAQGKPLRHLYLLAKQYPGCLDGKRNKEYTEKRAALFVSVLKSKQFSLLDSRLLQSVWDLFNRETKQAVTEELNECVTYLFTNEKELDAIEFLLSNYTFVHEENKERISSFVKKLINDRYPLTALSAPVLRKIVASVGKNRIKDVTKAHRLQLLLMLPHLDKLSVFEKFDDVCWRLLDKTTSEEIARSITSGETTYREFLDFLFGAKFRSWQRACLKNLLSALLQPDSFWALDLSLQIGLIHYTKDKGEYFNELKTLVHDILEKGVFDELDSKLKTALTIHCFYYLDLNDPEYTPLAAFLSSVLDVLTQNAYTHTDIKGTYGLRTDTLIYHILDAYKARPDKTAVICINSICKIYKQLLQLSCEDDWNPYKSRLLTDRVKLFKTVVANPCIKNIAQHYVEEMYRLINGAKMDDLDSHLKMLRKLLVKICKHGQWPNWFGVHPMNVCVRKEDTIRSAVRIDKQAFVIGPSNDSVALSEKAEKVLSEWRDQMDETLPLIPSKDNEIVALQFGNGYLPISGWGLVCACVRSEEDEFSPSQIEATVVSIAETDPLIFAASTEEVSYEKLLFLYEELFKDIMRLVPFNSKKKDWIKKGQQFYERISLKEDYSAIDKSIFPKLTAFLEFYYEHVFVEPNIRGYVLAPYYDYYKSVKKDVLQKLIEK